MGGVTVIDDAYNANPTSMASALETLSALDATGRRVAAVGDMLELGPSAPALHAEVGELAARLGIDLLVGTGPLMAHAVEAAKSAGIAAEVAADSSVAGDLLRDALEPGDILLIKGSRGMRMEDALVAVQKGKGN